MYGKAMEMATMLAFPICGWMRPFLCESKINSLSATWMNLDRNIAITVQHGGTSDVGEFVFKRRKVRGKHCSGGISNLPSVYSWWFAGVGIFSSISCLVWVSFASDRPVLELKIWPVACTRGWVCGALASVGDVSGRVSIKSSRFLYR